MKPTRLLVPLALVLVAGTLSATQQDAKTKANQPRKNAPPAAGEAARPEIPRHYPHIRIAQLAYAGFPNGPFEQKLLRESVDLVVANPRYLTSIAATAPQTPRLVYTNVTNLYQGLLTDWLAYADRHGHDREDAFYHVKKPTPFRGSSASSQPVTWFWNVGKDDTDLTTVPRWVDLTGAARESKFGAYNLPNSGALYVGFVDRFREVRADVKQPSSNGWKVVVEYPTQTTKDGGPAEWRKVERVEDGTAGWTQSGSVTFDPPADWKAGKYRGSAHLFYVRFRVTQAGRPPTVGTLLGRDYVGANGGQQGTMPAFDADADANKDGYLNDAEYAKRAAGKDARFRYESRLFYPYYGQMRFVTNPSAESVRAWVAHDQRLALGALPKADGFFLDNTTGTAPLGGAEVVEDAGKYAPDQAKLLAGLGQALAPRWLLANAIGTGPPADTVLREVPAVLQEFWLRPQSHNWSMFEHTAGVVASRLALSKPSPYVIVDSHPQGGQATDPRTQIGTLAYYYLVADRDATLLMFYGGFEPNTSWTRHWVPAAAFDVGKPEGGWSVRDQGADPANKEYTYKVYQRSYTKALVLYKPLSHARGKPAAGTGDATATEHDLKGSYRPLRADGSLGEAVGRVTLRNGEGAVLIKTGAN